MLAWLVRWGDSCGVALLMLGSGLFWRAKLDLWCGTPEYWFVPLPISFYSTKKRLTKKTDYLLVQS